MVEMSPFVSKFCFKVSLVYYHFYSWSHEQYISYRPHLVFLKLLPSLRQGTFNPYFGLNDTAQCTPCTEGSYCDAAGLNTTSGPCDPGYFCPLGQDSPRPVSYPCTVGHYCPLNSSQPIPCANGTYMNHTLAPACYVCPAGWWVMMSSELT